MSWLLPDPSKQRRRRIEWPTWGVLALCYGLWLVACACHQALGALFIPLAALSITLHSSLQHEVLHGHPTRNAALNEALVFPAPGLFIPYRRFKQTHLRHHRDERLTDPYDDPETWYRARRDWLATSAPMRGVLWANQTLFGRMLLGPALGSWALWRGDAPALLRGEAPMVGAYMRHLFGVALALGVACGVFGAPFLLYLCAAYLGFSLLAIRTFAEHRAAESVSERTAVVEAGAFFSLLFLNNNLHSVHHANPRAAWYDLPALYRSRRARVLEANGDYRYAGYAPLFRRYAFRTREPVAHPLMRRE